MKVRLTLEVGAVERYVIAKYFGAADGTAKPRATRRQVKQFVAGALASAVKEYAENMRGRRRATVQRLRAGRPEPEALEPPEERQPSLLNY